MRFEWYFDSKSHPGDVEDFKLKTTHESGDHTIYIVAGQPKAPMADVWTELLDVLCDSSAWCKGLQINDQLDIVAEITARVNAVGFSYYDDETYCRTGNIFDLTDCLGDLPVPQSTDTVNCRDCASMVVIFSGALGCKRDLKMFKIGGNGDDFYTNPICLIGKDVTESTHWQAEGFQYHFAAQQPTASGGEGKLYEATFHLNQTAPILLTNSVYDPEYKGMLVRSDCNPGTTPGGAAPGLE